MSDDLPHVFRPEGPDLLVVALLALAAGEALRTGVPVLRRYDIPSAVLGGLAFSVVLAVLAEAGVARVEPGTALRDLLLLVFFATVGLSMRWQALRENARDMLVLLVLATALLIFQNMAGSSVAAAFGFHPASGLLAGSVSFMGGHGTGVAWSAIFAQRFGLEDAEQAAVALATLGLVAGGLLGGPLAALLIRRHGLRGDAEPESETGDGAATRSGTWQGLSTPMLLTGIAVAGCTQAAPYLSSVLAGVGLTAPAFVVALALGALITNLAKACRIEGSGAAGMLLRDVSLQLFLVISIMSLRLPDVLHIAVPLMVVFVLQVLLVLAFVYFTAFPVLGRDYRAAVLCAGFTGFGLGATLVGVANMRAVVRRGGPAPGVFIIVPFVGSFLVDLANSAVIQLYLVSPVLD